MAEIVYRLPTVPANQLNRIKALILDRRTVLAAYWKPLHDRMDYWAAMYLMLDPIQQAKPIGVARRFVSNDPLTGPNAAESIMTANPIKWHIAQRQTDDENAEDRRKHGRIEETLEGLVYDLDELMSERLRPPFWNQVVFQALIRGMIWGKFHITTEALKYRESPLQAEIYDSRTVYPYVDQWGLNHVIIEKATTLGDLVASHPEKFQQELRSNNYNPAAPATKIEFWSNDRGERKGITAVLGIVGSPAGGAVHTGIAASTFHGQTAGPTEWLIEPYFHGYTPQSLPVVGVPVNGILMDFKPHISSVLETRLSERADLLAMQAMTWHGPNGWVAEMGRSILHAVEEQVPQYNELIATIFQHLTLGTYGTWAFKSPGGSLPNWEFGIESIIPLRPEESVQRLEMQPITPDAYKLVELLQQEREKGTISSIIRSMTDFSGSGVVFQQITNAVLNALDPYTKGFQTFSTRMGTSILSQIQLAAPLLRPFELRAANPKRSFFQIEFDPVKDLDATRHYRPVAIIKPALPDDITVRMTAARQALDPRRPLLSLTTVLETILEVDNPSAEVDRIFEDMAMNDPVLMPEQMAQAFERMGEFDLAARMRETEMQARMIEDIKTRQITSMLPQAPQGQGPGRGQEAGEGPGPAPAAGPLAQSTTRDGSSQQLPDGAEGAGAAGMRVSA